MTRQPVSKASDRTRGGEPEGRTLERRAFLKGLAAAPLVTTLGAGPKAGWPSPGPNDVVNVGVIGVGARGRGLMIAAGFARPEQLRGNQRLGTEGQDPLGIRIAGVCDCYDARADWGVTASGGAARRYRRFGDLLASREIDAVIVATPDHWHAPIASAAARAGKHVYLEKCFTHKVPETFELAKAVKESKVVLQLGHQRRSGALYTRAREVMKQGILGDVTLVQVFSNRNSPNGAWNYEIPPGAGPESIDWAQFLGNAPKRPFDPDRFFRWRKYWDYGTGLMGDLFSHEWDGVDLVMGGLGMPATAMASGGVYYWKEKREVPDVLQVAYEYPERNLTLVYNATLASSFARGPLYMGSDATMDLGRGVEVYADRESERNREKIQGGQIQLDRPIVSELVAGTVRGGNDSFVRSVSASGQTADVTYLHLKNWIEAIRNHRPAACNEDVGLREALTTHMGVLAYQWGCRVRWDPKRQKIVPDAAPSARS